MNKHDDGGPAFPFPGRNDSTPDGPIDGMFLTHCMTLWDHYFGLAMQGLMSNPNAGFETTARIAAEQADAMIAERKRRMEAAK